MKTIQPFPALRAICGLIMLVTTAQVAAQDKPSQQKLKVEDVISRHIASIGPPEVLAATKSRLISGTTSAISRGQGVSTISGEITFASTGNKNLLSMAFNSDVYPFERVGYDGQKVTVAFVKPGFRTVLGDTSYTYNIIYNQGLIGGSLSSAWPLLDPQLKGAKVRLEGKKKIDGRETYELSYKPKAGSDLQISIYIDANTFEHVRTLYTRTIAAKLGQTIDTSARRLEKHETLQEDFGDYKKEDGLNLPHSYKLRLAIQGESGSVETTWTSVLTSFKYNLNIAESEFYVEGNK